MYQVVRPHALFRPIAPFRKPNYFDFSALTSLVSALGNTAGTIFSSAQATKQIKAQTDAQLEAARLAAQASRPVYSTGSGNSNSVFLIVVLVIAALIIIGLVIWAVLRKK